MDIFKPMSAGSTWMILFFLLCNFGENVTNRFNGLRYSICDEWYLYPVDQQKYFILMILDANNLVYLDGFAIHITRELFKKVKSMK